MKPYYLIPLLFLPACSSTTPKLTLSPLPTPFENTDGIRYPEVLHAYHVGRYADPNDDLIMHEQHVVYRVEENTRWDLRPGTGPVPSVPLTHDAAFSPAPVNDAILAEVNSQRLATAEIKAEAQTLSAALGQFQTALQQTRTNFQETARLRVIVNDLQKRLDALAVAQAQASAPTLSTTNEPAGSSSP